MAERIISNLSKLRHRRGLTQEDVADKVGVTRQTIIAIEKGNYTPSVLLALKISKLFKKSVKDIFRYE